MKLFWSFLIVAALTLAAFADSQETAIALDVSRRNSSISLTYTEYCDYTVRATVRNGGDDYPLEGYDVNLVFGGTTSGCVYEGIITNVNEAVFNVDAASLPTNGTYTVQIMAMKNRRSSEWGSGKLRVKLNDGMYFMPSCWMGYQKVARLAASMISTTMITNEIFTAMFTDIASKITINIAAQTNPCVRIMKSFTDGLPIKTKFVFDGTNGTAMVFRNHEFTGSYFTMPTNKDFMAAEFYLQTTNGVERYLPERIGGKPWFRSTSASNNTFMVRGGYCTDAKMNSILIGE